MRRSRSGIVVSFAGSLLCAQASAQVTERVSVATGGTEGNGSSTTESISANSRFVVFESLASNLVPGDTNAVSDVFVRDVLNGTTERVSVDSNEQEANGASDLGKVAISADGRFVVYASLATNLVPGDTNGRWDIFLRDRSLGTTERMSVDSSGIQGNGDSSLATISADGRYVAFDSQSFNFFVGDTNASSDVFVRDRQTSTTVVASLDSGGALANGNSGDARLVADGHLVAFGSDATNLVVGDSNGFADIFLRDVTAGTTERISVDSGGAQGNGLSGRPSLSADGRYVAFESFATNLVAGDTNGAGDAFLRDRQAGTTERVTLGAGGVQGNSHSGEPSISSDARYVAFFSFAGNLVPGDTNGMIDVFVRDRQTGTTERVSIDSNGIQGSQSSSTTSGTLSADGRFVVFHSDAPNLVPSDANAATDVFLHDRDGGTESESLGDGGIPSNGGSFDPSISADNRFVAFESNATNLVPGDINLKKDIFVRDRQTATTTLVSVSSGGAQGNGDSSNPSMTADGRFVAFDSLASNLVGGDGNGVADVFVRDLLTGTTTRASISTAGVAGNGASTNPVFAAAGGAVAFESLATNLVTGDTNGVSDVYVRDLGTNATSRVSLDSTGTQGNGASVRPSISGNGLEVAFESAASNLVSGDTNLSADVFVRNRPASSTVRVSVDSGGTQGASASSDPSISTDGRFVAFASAANNLVAGDTNLSVDVFVRDRQLSTTVRVSADSGGTQGASASDDPSISADGRLVAFSSLANNLVGGDTNGALDVFARDLLFGTTQRVSVDSSGLEGSGGSSSASISADGRLVAFESDAPNLVPGDVNGFTDTFVRDNGVDSAFEAFCFGDGTGAPCPCNNSGAPGHGCENSATTGGALLTVTGVASFANDTVQFTSSGEKPTALSIFLQGTTTIAPVVYGDGLRCVGGALKRLYAKSAVAGVVVAPVTGDLSVSARSAFMNQPIPLGSTRSYMVYYRDVTPATFCPTPQGSNFNGTNGMLVAWGG